MESLRPDTALLHRLQADPQLDYTRELMPRQSGVWEWLKQKLVDYLRRLFDGIGGGDPTTLIVTIAVLVLVGIVVFLVVRHPGLFFRNRRMEDAVVADEDNIYGVDFDEEIATARAAGDWRRVVRMAYLRTLRALADGGRIDWRPSKTPTQYTYEVTDPPFKQMTRQFLRVRYGGFPADRAMADEMEALGGEVLAGEAAGDAAAGDGNHRLQGSNFKVQ